MFDILGKLKLEFPKGRHKKYGSVPFQYEERHGKIITNLTSINRRKLQVNLMAYIITKKRYFIRKTFKK